MNKSSTTPNAVGATQPTLDTFTRAYIECALWSSTDNADDSGGEPLDNNYDISDIAPESLARIIADCAKFQAGANSHFIAWDRQRAGHDFWLTRNGHGAGFWDGDWSEPAATELTNQSEDFGTCDLYVGDDGQLYI